MDFTPVKREHVEKALADLDAGAAPVRLNTGSGRTFGMLNQNSRERSEFRFR